jgi:hypothetical protein
MKRSTTVDWLWLVGWALVSSVWCVTAASQLSATFDEPTYIVRGLDAWRSGSHSGLMKLGTMPLAVDVATLPLFIAERWRGTAFDTSSQLVQLLPWARAAALVFWWLLLFYAWRAGRVLAGVWAGRLAVALVACEPTMLAHASLATTDIAVSGCVLALAYHFRMARDRGWLRRVGVPALWYAAAVLAKASGLVYGPLCLLAVEVTQVTAGDAVGTKARLASFKPFLGDLLQIVFYGLVLVFLYCGSDWRVEPSFVAWAQSVSDGPLRQSTLWLAEHLRIFSNAGEGLARQIKHNLRGPGGHWAYLLGTQRRAFWYYFPVALSLKLSVPLLALPLVIGALRPRALWNWANLAAAVLLLFSLTARVQIGVRLVLPLVALAAVGLAASVVETCRSLTTTWARNACAAAAGIGVACTAVAAISVWPNGLSYTNRLGGGTERGYLSLSDSNYDWGQGLPELARWQTAHGGGTLHVWYFGTDPRVGAPPLTPLPLHLMPIVQPRDVLTYAPGRLAVSTTLLYGTDISAAQRQAATFLRGLQPVARTATFFIFDLSQASHRRLDSDAHDTGVDCG